MDLRGKIAAAENAIRTMREYTDVVAAFARDGARLISEDPQKRYEQLGRSARNRLEPGWIPVRARPLLTTVSYYPNESELPSPEWAAMERSFANWGQQGTASAYADAYNDFLAIRPQIPFYRKWERDLYSGLGLAEDDSAWLPFFKLPMKQGSSPDVDGIDAQRDRNELWDQLNLLRPEVVLLQSDRVANVLRERLRNLDFIVAVEVQKIPQFISSEKRRKDISRIVGALKPHVDKARTSRAAQLT